MEKITLKVKLYMLDSFVGISISSIVIYNKIITNKNLSIDSNVVIASDTKSIQDKLDEENKRVQDGMLAISMTTEPTFPDGKSLGKVMIKNPAQNTKNFTVKFVLNDTNEEVYKSGLIPPGGLLEKAKLNKQLSKGRYSATAYFESYDENNEISGEVGFDISINILN